MIHHRGLCSRIAAVCGFVVGLVLVASPPAGAVQMQYASSWQGQPSGVGRWVPSETSSQVLGAPEGTGSSLCVAASSNPTPATAQFNFSGFSIPVTDTIQGVVVRMKYETVDAHTVQLTDGGSLVGSTRTMPAFDGPNTCDGTSWVQAGGMADTWGVAAGILTPAKINNGDIGFHFTQFKDPSKENTATVDIDAVELIIYHGPANTPPTANAGGPYVVAEGGSVGLSAAGSSDPDQSTASLTFEWDLDNDGMFDDAVGISPTFSAAGKDGQGLGQTIKVRVTDSAMASDIAMTTVTINNVAPSVATPSVSPEPSDEGAAATASASFTDPAGALDAPFTCTVDYGDGSGPVAGTVAGFTCTGPAHVYGDNGGYTVTVAVTDKDTAAGSNSSLHQVSNVPPTVSAPVVTPEPSDEGSAVTASATFTDPGTDDSPFTCTVDYGEGDGPQAGTVSGSSCDGPSHSYGDNGTYSVTVCVKDKDDGEGCESADHEVLNVPPTVAAPVVDPEPSEEGASVTASATFTDPGTDDSPFTCTVDYDTADASVTPVAGTISGGDTCTGPSYTYGDNYTPNVEICVTDKDDGEGCADSDHVVDNVAPDAQLDTSGAITFPSGEEAFIGRQDDEQSHDADADDPGSDDLTFAWDFGFPGATTTYFNDTGDEFGTPDPTPSPGGTFPFSASDTASVTFAAPGVYTVRVDVTDDDGGSDFDDLPKLVTGDGRCAFSQGFWSHQFSGRGTPHVDVLTQQAYLDLVDFASGVFSEAVPAATPSEAQAVFAPGGPFYDKAVRQTLAAWLNWASGGVGWDEGIDLDGDSVPDLQFSALIATVEAILLDPAASHADLELAKDLAEAVNLKDESTTTCHPKVGTRRILVR